MNETQQHTVYSYSPRMHPKDNKINKKKLIMGQMESAPGWGLIEEGGDLIEVIES